MQPLPEVFTRRQALAAGWSPGQVRTLLRGGRWVPLHQGAYVDAAHLAAAAAHERHLLLADAYLAVLRPDHVLSHRSAAVAHHLPLLGELPARPLVTRSPRTATDASPGRFVRVARLAEHDVVLRSGRQVTSLARTAVDVARHEAPRSAVVVADAALRAGADPAALAEVAERCRDWPGGRRGLTVVRFADGRADGPLESLARWAFHLGGLPAPELQVPVRDADGRLLGVVDFLWRAHRTVGEVDGMLKYQQPLDLQREKQREDDLRRAGLEVVRAGWAEVHRRPELLCRRVRDAFTLAERHRADPVRFVLPAA